MEQETTIEKIETLESEIRDYANTLPYWGKYLANQILSGQEVTDDNITSAYSFLLEDLHLKEKSDRPEITLGTRSINATDYKWNLLFSKLETVEGVNALVENQTIDFSKNLTVIYGTTQMWALIYGSIGMMTLQVIIITVGWNVKAKTGT